MPRNKLVDLNNILFEQLERLNDEELEGEAFEKELKRAKAISEVGKNIIDNASLALQAKKHFDITGGDRAAVPEMLKLENKG